MLEWDSNQKRQRACTLALWENDCDMSVVQNGLWMLDSIITNVSEVYRDADKGEWCFG